MKMKLPPYDEDHLFFGMLFMISNRLQVIGDHFFEEITTKQWFVLVVLEIFGEEYPTFNELAEGVGSSHQNVKQLVVKLEEKGFVRILKDPLDRRKSRIALTLKMKSIVEKYREKEEQFLNGLFAGIRTEDLRKAVSVFLKMQENMECMSD